MEIDEHEQALVNRARQNPHVFNTWVPVGVGAVMLAASAAGFITEPGRFSFLQLGQALMWLAYALLLRHHLRFQESALSLIAKLDGSHRPGPDTPSSLGLQGAASSKRGGAS